MIEKNKIKDESLACLKTQDFEADVTKVGLYKKKLPDGITAFWDFRKTIKGHFYVTNAIKDGGAFWAEDDAKALPEYIALRKVLPDDEKQSLQVHEMQQGAKSYITSTPTDDEYMRGTEQKIIRIMDTKLQLDSIISASKDSKKPGEGLLWHELIFINKKGEKTIHKEPSVELVDMIAQDMGNITTRIVEFNTNILENPNTGKKYLTYYCVVEAIDGITKTSGLGAAEQIIDFSEIENNNRTFARTNAIRKAERNAKERMIPIPRRALVDLVQKKLWEYQKTQKQSVSS